MKVVIDIIKDESLEKFIPKEFKVEWDRIVEYVDNMVKRDSESVFKQANKPLPMDNIPD